MRSLGGTDVSASRLMAVIVGRIMIESTSAAGSTPGPLRSVPNGGIHPIFKCSQLQPGRMSGITTNKPHNPYTTLGMAASNSIRFFSRFSNWSGSLPKTG